MKRSNFRSFWALLLLFISQSIFGQSAPDTLIRLKEFEITDMMGRKILQPANRVGQEFIERMPARDIGDFLRSQPNVAGIRKGGTGIDPVIRGFKYSQLNVQLNEGQKIEAACPNRMDPPTAHVDIDDVKIIEIFKGPYALRFGPNFGGLVHLHTWPTQRPEKFEAKVEAMAGFESAWMGMKQGLGVTLGGKYFQAKVSGNYKKYGDYEDGNGNVVASSFERYNYSIWARVTPNDRHSVTLSEDRATGKNLDFPALPMDERLDRTLLLSADYVYRNPGHILQGAHAKVYRSDVDHEMDNKQRPVSDTVVAVSKINAINTGYRAEATFSLAGGSLHAGTDMEDIRKDGDRVKTFIMQPTMPIKTEKLWDQAFITNYGLFAEYSHLFGKFSAVAAIRLDFNKAGSNPMTAESMQGQQVYYDDETTSNHTNFSFSAGADWKLPQGFSLNLSAGRGGRSPDMTERFIILLPIGYDNYDYLGNPTLEPEVNYQADLAAVWESKVAGRISAGIFFSLVKNFISGNLLPESVVMPQTKGVYGVKQFINIEMARLSGFEIQYVSPSDKKWLLEASAGYTCAVNPEAVHYRIENGEVTGSEIVKNDPLSEIPPFESSLHFSWKFFQNRLVPKVSFRAVAAQNRVSVAYDEKASPGFFLAGFSVYYQMSSMFQVSAGVDNLFDQAYYEHLNRNMIGTQANFYEPGRNFYINIRFKI